MYDEELVLDSLQNVEIALNEIVEWTAHVRSVDDFATSPERVILLNAVCMKLFAICEEIKVIDKRTHGELLPLYPTVDWRKAMRMRDVMAHHYFEIDASVVLQTLHDDIRPLLTAVVQIKADLQKA